MASNGLLDDGTSVRKEEFGKRNYTYVGERTYVLLWGVVVLLGRGVLFDNSFGDKEQGKDLRRLLIALRRRKAASGSI